MPDSNTKLEKKQKNGNGSSKDTLISGETDRVRIERAVRSFVAGFGEFISPPDLGKSARFAKIAELSQVIKERITRVESLIVDIIVSINERAQVLASQEYKELISQEAQQWRKGDTAELEHGIRVCVDAGVPREAVAGSEGHMGRTLAGDDDLDYVPERNGFSLAPSALLKRLIHSARMNRRVMLEIFVEHTGCGRRGQMIANLEKDNQMARLYKLVFENLVALEVEFPDKESVVHESLKKIQQHWDSGQMVKDGGTWSGILVKIAQKQAYRDASPDLTPVVQIQIYDKKDGNEFVGIDSLQALTHPKVIEEGGYTPAALQELVKEEVIFSLRHKVESMNDLLQRELRVQKGENTFADLQKNWLMVKTKFVTTTEDLWRMYDSPDSRYDGIRSMADNFLKLSLSAVDNDLKNVDAGSAKDHVTSGLMKRRLIHQLFRSLAYSWILDTFEKGNPPGTHMEDHLATGESAVLGVKEHLPLGQGDLQPPTVDELITGYSVLMHSKPGEKGEPVVLVMKHDTHQLGSEPLTTEESQRALDDFAELLKLWPYLMVGNIVPVVAIRDKKHGGIGRLALSVPLSFKDILTQAAREGRLPNLIPASNSRGEVVRITADSILGAGVTAGKDLKAFRKAVTKLADDATDLQKYLRD